MSTRTRAGLILAATLLIGMVIGFLSAGAIGQRRAERVARMRAQGGFVEFMVETLQPHNAAQRAEIVPILEQTARRNAEIFDASRQEIAAEMDSLRLRLTPILDAEQLERLDDAGRFRRGRRPGPGQAERPPGRERRSPRQAP